MGVQTARLETRTKESNDDASVRVWKPERATKVIFPFQRRLIFFYWSVGARTRKMVNYA